MSQKSPQTIYILGPEPDKFSPDVVPQRRDIVELVKDKYQWSLYIQALQRLQQDPHKKYGDASYFEMAGIHGLPKENWNHTIDEPAVWYCEHETVLFPTWHRPYVSLIEQFINRVAQEVALEYHTSDRETWIEAAAALRIPYWDWAGQPLLPDQIYVSQTLSITTPKGEEQVTNPFFKWDFKKGEQQFTTPPNQPSFNRGLDPAQLKRTLVPSQRTWRRQLAELFAFADTWHKFSNGSFRPNEKDTVNSLEQIHGSVHVTMGQYMEDVAYAAFDPVFWLHHCQVDRVIALWQVLNENEWVPEEGNLGGEFDRPDKNLHTDLIPFRYRQEAGKNIYWTSAEIKDVRVFNYNYKELADAPPKGQARVDYIRNLIVEKYGRVAGAPSSPLSVQAASAQVPAETEPAPLWTARVRINAHALHQSFSVYIFIGDSIPSDPSEWRESPSYAGRADFFMNSASDQCENCQTQTAAGTITEAFVQLTDFLNADQAIQTLDEDEVSAYLKEKLQWRVATTRGDVVTIPSLEVVLQKTPVSLPQGAALPVAGTPKRFRDVTFGKEGGARRQNASQA